MYAGPVDSNVCGRELHNGGQTCLQHTWETMALRRIVKNSMMPARPYVVVLGIKPARRYKDAQGRTRYHKTVVGKAFPCRDTAEAWTKVMGARMWRLRPGQRVTSYSIERMPI